MRPDEWLPTSSTKTVLTPDFVEDCLREAAAIRQRIDRGLPFRNEDVVKAAWLLENVPRLVEAVKTETKEIHDHA